MRPTTTRFFVVRHGWRLAACLAAAAVFFQLLAPNPALGEPGSTTGLTPICALQGKGFRSFFEGQTVRTEGVVYLDLDETSKKGFFLQAQDCDGDPSTSDGLFVYLGVRGPLVATGDRVEVTGLVQEYYSMTELRADPSGVLLVAPAQSLPVPVDVAPPFEPKQSDLYFERLEGMSVRLDDARVVGPTDTDGRTWAVRADLGIERVFQDDPAGTGEILCLEDGGLYEVMPQPKTGDRITGLAGALDYMAGSYCMQLSVPPAVIPVLDAVLDRGELLLHNRDFLSQKTTFSIATFNLADLFDTQDDPAKQDTVLSGAEYQRRLEKRALAIHETLGEPEILAVQEVENRAVLEALLGRPEIGSKYEILWVEGPDERGIDVALLVRSDRIRVLEMQIRQGCTQLFDGFGPDGNRDPFNPQNAITCDADSDGILDGNRLFSRPPLIAHLEVCQGICAPGVGYNGLWVIVNHLKSKVEDLDTIQFTAARREQEARFVAGLGREILADPGANLVVLGDLNDFPASLPLAILKETGLSDVWSAVERPGRYSYNYQGVSQVLDYILVYLNPPFSLASADSGHVNADYPVSFNPVGSSFHRSSDHDPLLVRIRWMEKLLYLPALCR